jgi:FkbM family methyltransferase
VRTRGPDSVVSREQAESVSVPPILASSTSGSWMTALHRARMLARRLLKVDVVRYPGSDPLRRPVQLLRTAGVNVVLDVGANDGGYARAIRSLGYDGRIVSFEPTRDAYARLDEATRQDPRWRGMQFALGDRDGDVDIHVAGNAAASSSILPMLARHSDAQPDSAYTHTERVSIKRLDDLMPDLCPDGSVCFLKLDVQGAEGAVLAGATASLQRVVGVQIEMNLAPLYEGQSAYRTLLDHMLEQGFELADLLPGFSDRRTGQLLAADGVFMRPERIVAAPG